MTKRGQWLLAAAIPIAFACCTELAGAQGAQAPAPAAARNFELPPLDDLQATRERPLFSPTRRPPSIVAAPEAPPPITEAVALPFELTGIALGEELRIAILHNKTTNEEVRVHQGDSVEEWTLETVGDRFILLRGDGRRVRVWLFDNSKKPGVQVRQVDGAEESSAEAIPGTDVDQEVVPRATPVMRVPATTPLAPVLKRVMRPPGPARATPMARPAAKPQQVRRN